MKKLILILPVLFLVLSPVSGSGLAMDDSGPEGAFTGKNFNHLSAPELALSMDEMIPFAITADDGGALLEKARVRAMREAGI